MLRGANPSLVYDAIEAWLLSAIVVTARRAPAALAASRRAMMPKACTPWCRRAGIVASSKKYTSSAPSRSV